MGKGYSDEFVANFKKIIQRLNNNECFEIVNNLDSICASCPRHNGKICSDQAKVAKLDQKYTELLNIEKGDILSWKRAKRLIKDKINKQNFSIICAECEWISVCEQLVHP